MDGLPHRLVVHVDVGPWLGDTSDLGPFETEQRVKLPVLEIGTIDCGAQTLADDAYVPRRERFEAQVGVSASRR